jgi:hypothetical protein
MSKYNKIVFINYIYYIDIKNKSVYVILNESICIIIMIFVFLDVILFDFGSIQLQLEHYQCHFYPHPSTLLVYDPFFSVFVLELMLSRLIYHSHVDY